MLNKAAGQLAAFPLDDALIHQPDMIPLSAVGREPVFFFGTLMDVRVLAFILGRPVADDELSPAILQGYRRMRARDAVYPVLVRDAQSTMEGRLLWPQTARDLVRINHFEEDEYIASQIEVSQAGETLSAWAYIGLDHMPASDEVWSLERWAEIDLEAFLKRCEFWMQDSPL